jgi:cell division protein FtsN
MKLLRLFLAIAVVMFVGCKDISDKLSDKKVEKVEAEDPEVYAEDEKEIVEEEVKTTETEPIEKKEVTAEIDQKEKIAPGKFYIIGGSFKEYQKAEQLYKQLTTKGYTETQILDPVNNFRRVVISSFTNEAEARAELKKLRAQYNDQTIWLLSVK